MRKQKYIPFFFNIRKWSLNFWSNNFIRCPLDNPKNPYIYCGDRSINGPIGFRIDSGLLDPWPIQGRVSVRGRHTPRQYASEDDRDVVLLRSDLRIRSP